MVRDILLFAQMAQIANTKKVRVSLDPDLTVCEVRSRVAREFPDLAPWIRLCAVALDLHLAEDQVRIGGAQEIAFLPPVSGG
jgi:molybdopterin converting factor small subunit